MLHVLGEIVLKAGESADFIWPTDNSYAEAQLARAAIAYMLRSPQDMDATQREAFDEVRRDDFKGLIGA